MLFIKLFKWDENIVISDTSTKPLPLLTVSKPIKTDFVSDILKEDPMFLSG